MVPAGSRPAGRFRDARTMPPWWRWPAPAGGRRSARSCSAATGACSASRAAWCTTTPEAEDVVQAAYVQAFEHLATFRGDGVAGDLADAHRPQRGQRPPARTQAHGRASTPSKRCSSEGGRVIAFPNRAFGSEDPGRRAPRAAKSARMLEHAVDELPEAFPPGVRDARDRGMQRRGHRDVPGRCARKRSRRACIARGDCCAPRCTNASRRRSATRSRSSARVAIA